MLSRPGFIIQYPNGTSISYNSEETIRRIVRRTELFQLELKMAKLLHRRDKYNRKQWAIVEQLNRDLKEYEWTLSADEREIMGDVRQHLEKKLTAINRIKKAQEAKRQRERKDKSVLVEFTCPACGLVQRHTFSTFPPEDYPKQVIFKVEDCWGCGKEIQREWPDGKAFYAFFRAVGYKI